MGKANAQTLATQALIGEIEKIRKSQEEISKMYQDIKEIQRQSETYIQKVEKRLIEASSRELDTSKLDQVIMKFNKDLEEAQSKAIKSSPFQVQLMLGALVIVFISMSFALWYRDTSETWKGVAGEYYEYSTYLKEKYLEDGKLEEEDLKKIITPDQLYEKRD